MKKYFWISIFCFSLLQISFGQSTKGVLVEKFTSASCGHCPDAAVLLDSLSTQYPEIIWVSHHAGFIRDSMWFSELDDLAFAYTSGTPTAAIDRYTFAGESNVAVQRSKWDAYISQRLAEPTTAVLHTSGSYDSLTRELSLQAAVNFEALPFPATHDYRLTVLLVEDSVQGSGTGYQQSSYYNNVAGHPLEGLGNPIQEYPHRYVNRDFLTDRWGDAQIVPNTPSTGVWYAQNYNYTLPSNFNPARMSVVAFVAAFNGGVVAHEVFNASQIKLSDLQEDSPVAVQEIETADAFDFDILSKPSAGQLCLNVHATEATVLELQIFDNLGHQLLPSSYNFVNLGQSMLVADLEFLANGIYTVVLRNEEQRVTKRFLR